MLWNLLGGSAKESFFFIGLVPPSWFSRVSMMIVRWHALPLKGTHLPHFFGVFWGQMQVQIKITGTHCRWFNPWYLYINREECIDVCISTCVYIYIYIHIIHIYFIYTTYIWYIVSSIVRYHICWSFATPVLTDLLLPTSRWLCRWPWMRS
jgi:hypothetical protein